MQGGTNHFTLRGMEPEAITDQESLRRWLEGRPREDAFFIAQRAALRVLPVWVDALSGSWARKGELTAQPVLRALLTSGVAHKYPSPEVKAAAAAADAALAAAARAAAAAARAAAWSAADANYAAAWSAAVAAMATADAADSAALSAAAAARAAAWSAADATYAAALSAADATYAADAWREVARDARALLDGTAEARALWDTPPDPIRDLIHHMRNVWAPATQGGAFWMRWYQGFLDGRPLSWDLQRDIALIPDAEWDKGEAHIAGLIEAIETDHAIAATPIGEVIERGADGLFFAVPTTDARSDLFRNAKEKVADTVAEIRAQLGHNIIRAIESDLNRLDDHLKRYAENPLRIHDVFEKTIRHINSKLATTEIAREELIDDLLQDCDAGAIDIRRSDPEVAKAAKARASVRLGRIKAGQRERYAQAVMGAASEARADLSVELLEDLTATANAPTPSADAADRDEPEYRLVGRTLRMAKRRKDDLVKAADDLGKIEKGAAVAGKVVDAAPAWWDWILSNLGGLFS